MFNEVITLVDEKQIVNDYGDVVKIRTEREVFAQLKSIGQNEFYQAQAVGLKPEIKFVLPDYLEYQNEKKLKYRPFGGVEDTYHVLRTYRDGNSLELVCYKEVIQ